MPYLQKEPSVNSSLKGSPRLSAPDSSKKKQSDDIPLQSLGGEDSEAYFKFLSSKEPSKSSERDSQHSDNASSSASKELCDTNVIFPEPPYAVKSSPTFLKGRIERAETLVKETKSARQTTPQPEEKSAPQVYEIQAESPSPSSSEEQLESLEKSPERQPECEPGAELDLSDEELEISYDCIPWFGIMCDIVTYPIIIVMGTIGIYYLAEMLFQSLLPVTKPKD